MNSDTARSHPIIDIISVTLLIYVRKVYREALTDAHTPTDSGKFEPNFMVLIK